MTNTIPVSAHTRRAPEKAPDPFSAVIQSRRPAYASKWGLAVDAANDSEPASVDQPGWVRLSVIERFMPWFGRR